MDIKAVAVYDSSSSLKRLIWNNIKKNSYLRLFYNEYTLPLVACIVIINYPRRLSHCFLVDTFFIHRKILDFKLKGSDLIARIVVPLPTEEEVSPPIHSPTFLPS
jgi:hypothetical protein